MILVSFLLLVFLPISKTSSESLLILVTELNAAEYFGTAAFSFFYGQRSTLDDSGILTLMPLAGLDSKWQKNITSGPR